MRRERSVIVIALAALISSCGGGSESATTTAPPGSDVSTTIAPATSAATTQAPSTTTSEPPTTTTVAPTTTSTTSTTTTSTSTTTSTTSTTTTSEPPTTVPTPAPAPPYDEYVTLTDESGLISVDVPAAWNDVRRDGWDSALYDDGIAGPALSATTDQDRYRTTWEVPGLFIGASALLGLSVQEVIDSYWFGDECTFDGQFEYDDGAYTGFVDEYSDCGGEGTALYQIAAEPADGSFIVTVQVQMVTTADVEAADTIINTFWVDPLGG